MIKIKLFPGRSLLRNRSREREKMNKLKLFLSVMTVLIVAVQLSSIGQALPPAAEDKPSSWAAAEIEAAKAAGLVPDPLQKNYRTNITRSRYVLIALKAFGLSGKSVSIEDHHPFLDIAGHEYEEDIIFAYNAGIVKGDGKGHFFPDAFITREEIASLVVNLLARMAGDGDDPVPSESYEFADGAEISEWAKGYIDICFEKKILTGIGQNKILPKGNATVEQSIAMLYRLVKNEGLLDKSPYGTLKLSDKNLNGDEPDTAMMNEFVQTHGTELFEILQELSGEEGVAVIEMRETSVTLFINNINTIHLDKSGDEKTLFAMMHQMNDELSISIFRRLLGSFEPSGRAARLLDEWLPGMKAGEWMEMAENTEAGHDFSIETQKEDTKCIYFIRYTEK